MGGWWWSPLPRSQQDFRDVYSKVETMRNISFGATTEQVRQPRDWNLPLTYPPKIEPVRRGECTQTMRFCTVSKSKKHPGEIIRKQVGDRVRFYRWTGRPYWSHPEYITEYMNLVTAKDILLLPAGIIATFDRDDCDLPRDTYSRCTLWGWDELDFLAIKDFIAPPTGEALRDVLIGKNGKIPAEGVPAQILRWDP
jgi:hypothetical protein